MTEEKIRFENNIGLTSLNAFAYGLEFFFLLLSLVIMTVYLCISKLNRCFHSMLRILMNTMCFGMLFNSLFRICMVPIRLFLGHDYRIQWLQSFDLFCATAQLIAILQIDSTAFLISIERLIATKFIRRYEHMFSTNEHRVFFTTVLLTSLYATSFYLFIARGDVYKETPMKTLMYISYVMTATNVIGLVFLGITYVLSKRHLRSLNKALSKSYQCKENLRVVRIISPVYVLLFFTRFCQFAFRVYTYYVGFSMGAFLLRLLAHMYNISLSLSVFVSPLLLIVLQPQMLEKICKRPMKKLDHSHGDHNRTTEIYFEDLRKAWSI